MRFFTITTFFQLYEVFVRADLNDLAMSSYCDELLVHGNACIHTDKVEEIELYMNTDGSVDVILVSDEDYVWDEVGGEEEDMYEDMEEALVSHDQWKRKRTWWEQDYIYGSFDDGDRQWWHLSKSKARRRAKQGKTNHISALMNRLL